MRTTIDINDAQLRELRARATASGRPLRQVVEEVIGLGLSVAEKAGSRRAMRFRVKPHRLGLKPAYRGVSLNQLYDQLEAEETAPLRSGASATADQ